MAKELAGKVAIVTGGASGIGRATTELFVEEGAQVVIADVNPELGEEVAAALGAAATFKRTDVAQADEVQELVDFAVGHFGGLHVMFNNAGIGSAFDRFLEYDFADYERVMAVNLYGVMIGSQRAARHMAAHGGGSIVNTTSIAALSGGAAPITYRASKAAVIQFSRSIAIDLAEHEIRVNCIAPGAYRDRDHELRHGFGHPAHAAAPAPRLTGGRRERGALPRERAVGASDRDRDPGRRGDRRRSAAERDARDHGARERSSRSPLTPVPHACQKPLSTRRWRSLQRKRISRSQIRHEPVRRS